MRLPVILFSVASLALFTACDDAPTQFTFPHNGGTQTTRDVGSNPEFDGGTVDTGAVLDTGTGDDAGTVVPDAAVEDTGTQPEPPTGDYDHVGFTAAQVQVTSDGANITFRGQTENATSILSVASYADWAGPTSPGSYSLDGINYADCGLCLILSSGCDSESCAKTFYADAGDVDIRAIGFGEGEQFSGTLRDVVFTEVTITPDTFISTPVPGAETWLVDDFEFNGFVSSAPQAGECDSGRFDCIGDMVSSFELQSCATGEFINIQDLNATADGTWIVMTAGWCSACHTWIPQVFNALSNDLSEFDINLMVVLGEDTSGGAPTIAYCEGYGNQYDHGLDNFYIDNSGGQSYATVFENVWIYPGDDGSFGLPWNGMFRGGTGEYVYADGAGVGDVNTGINEMLR